MPISDLAFRVLRLEQQLESYQRLHGDELAEMRRAIEELAAEVLALAAASRQAGATQTAAGPTAATPGDGITTGPAEAKPG